jgi:hypothetical protein
MNTAQRVKPFIFLLKVFINFDHCSENCTSQLRLDYGEFPVTNLHTCSSNTVSVRFQWQLKQLKHMLRNICPDVQLGEVLWDRTIPTERPPLVGEAFANFCG